MPTPNETVAEIPASAPEASRPSRMQLACPEEASIAHSRQQPQIPEHRDLAASSPYPSDVDHPSSEDEPSPSESATALVQDRKPSKTRDSRLLASPTIEQRICARRRSLMHGHPASLYSPFPSPITSQRRTLPSYTSSYLRPGSKFVGKQRSDHSTYEVHVELKHVDIAESFLCGYLKIKGLTEDHPTLTTYFEGEMIGDKYTFQTRRPEWNSNEKNDFQHWLQFPAFRPLLNKAKQPEFSYVNFAQQEHIFMRWKEHFLVPDHRVRQIHGASFEGFYFICFNQVTGTVDGIYFHSKSERFQKLHLEHVEEKTFACVEFR